MEDRAGVSAGRTVAKSGWPDTRGVLAAALCRAWCIQHTAMQSGADGGAALALGADSADGHGKGSGANRGTGKGQGCSPRRPGAAPWGAAPESGHSRRFGSISGPVPEHPAVPAVSTGQSLRLQGVREGRTRSPGFGEVATAFQGAPNPCLSGGTERSGRKSREKEPGEVGVGGAEGRAPRGRHEPRAAPGGRSAPVAPRRGRFRLRK